MPKFNKRYVVFGERNESPSATIFSSNSLKKARGIARTTKGAKLWRQSKVTKAERKRGVGSFSGYVTRKRLKIRR